VVAIHLANTFLLLAAIALTAAFADRPEGLSFRGRGSIAAAFGLGLATLMLGCATGAIAALGDTLFPAATFTEGLRQELTAGAPLLLRLRMIHPFAAIAASIVLVVCARAALRSRPAGKARTLALGLLALVGLELLVGAANLALLAPIWLQLVHLALADLAWIALVLLAAEMLAPAARAVPELRFDAAAAQHG
jgi:cytochrome c oxidase assembly protein subunit 15